MNITDRSVGGVFERAIKSPESKTTKFSCSFSQLMKGLKFIKNSDANLHPAKEWKRTVTAKFPLGIKASDILHPQTLQNSCSDVTVTNLVQSVDLAREKRLNPQFISKPVCSDNTPACFKQFKNMDAF